MSADLVASMQAEATALESQIDDAKTREEALDLAIKATEVLFKALNKAKDSPSRTRINSKCQDLLGKAEQIKAADSWPKIDAPKSPQADVAEAVEAMNGLRVAKAPSTRISPASVASASKKSQIASGSSRRDEVSKYHVTTATKLVEPKSQRALSTAEQLLILRASKLNGFKFPPWEAPPFPEEFNLESGEQLFEDTERLSLSAFQRSILDDWKRPEEALPPPASVSASSVKHGPTMRSETTKMDLTQDVASDCSVIASLCAATARAKQGHEPLLTTILYPHDETRSMPSMSMNGKYIVRLNFNGCYRKVTVDDYLPVTTTGRVLHVIDRQNPSLLWPALIEKAYLKVRGGYDFPGSNSGTDLWIITGWIPEQVFLQSDDTIPSQLWRRMWAAFNAGDVLATVGTGKMSHRAEHESGLVGEHCYAVIGVQEFDGQRLLLLKNPWSEGASWRGRTPRLPSAENGQVEFGDQLTPGTFWMDLDDIMQHFESMYLNWNPGLFRHRQDYHFTWDLTDATKRGPPSSFIRHPQFTLRSEQGGLVWCLLNRHFQDKPVNNPKSQSQDSRISEGYLSIYAWDNHAGRKVFLSDGSLERGPYVDSPHTLLRLELPPKSLYTLALSEQDLPSAAHAFTLSAFSDSPASLEVARHRYSNEVAVASEWSSETAGGNVRSGKYSKNPQCRLVVKDATPVAMLLETPSENINLHVKLVHGRGERVLKVSRKDIIVDSGDYRRGAAFAEISNVDPGIYTIICSTFESGQQAKFKLQVYTMTPAHLTELPKEGAGRLRTSHRAVFSSRVTKLAAPIRPERLIRVKAVARFTKFLCPVGSGSESSMPPLEGRTHSAVRVSIELGRGPDRRILIASCNGEYSDDDAGAWTEDVDLSPTLRQGGDIFLVLDRLSIPAVTGEEYYEVELYCDSPDAFQVGVFRTWDD